MIERQFTIKDVPKPNSVEIQRILSERAELTSQDPDYNKKLGELAEDAGAQIEAHLAHRTQNDAGSNFDELHEITQEWERLNGNVTLDGKE